MKNTHQIKKARDGSALQGKRKATAKYKASPEYKEIIRQKELQKNIPIPEPSLSAEAILLAMLSKRITKAKK